MKQSGKVIVYVFSFTLSACLVTKLNATGILKYLYYGICIITRYQNIRYSPKYTTHAVSFYIQLLNFLSKGKKSCVICFI